MAIMDLYSSGVHKRNLGHFANVLKLAISDNQITGNEQTIINRLKKRLQISDAEYHTIVENPHKYPITPPVDLSRRLERFYNLIQIILADLEVRLEEIQVLRKIAVGLGFSAERLDHLIDKSILLVRTGVAQEQFVEDLKKDQKI
jgi:uncharacterized tellurite resistance protein B-like protein